jgi:threonine dehydrogenase-like Zn-dependent dehydrogenase
MRSLNSAVRIGRKPSAMSVAKAVESQQAVVLVRPAVTRVRSVAIPAPGEHELRVRLQGCGICASHLPLWEGRPWFNYPQEAGAPGHEGWGVIDAVGAGIDDLEVGQRVAFASGHAFAQFDITSRNCVVPLPEELDDEPFPGEAFAHAMNVIERSDIRAGHKVAIVGGGFVGLLLTQLAADKGAHVVVLSRRPFALGLAESMEADETVLLRCDGGDANRAMRASGGDGFDRVIETSGTQAALHLARQICAEHGRLVIAGDPPERPESGLIVEQAPGRSAERYVSGVQKAIQAMLEGQLDPFPLLSHTVSLGSLDVGFRLTRERPEGFVKALLLHET